mmetsp:Transcript_2571/g.3260  ORF Transcript_2571/g.3260 Transcript_2571/m.3260 type:complete len:179 (-) Transcript_2571:708-1244(-)
MTKCVDVATVNRYCWIIKQEIESCELSTEDFIEMTIQEQNSIRRNVSTSEKPIRFKMTEETVSAYDAACLILLKMVSQVHNPFQSVLQILLPMNTSLVRNAQSPVEAINSLDSNILSLSLYVSRFIYFYKCSGILEFASRMAKTLVTDVDMVKNVIRQLSMSDINQSKNYSRMKKKIF